MCGSSCCGGSSVRDWLAEEPDTATREAKALELLADVGLPTPRLVAVDPDGSARGRAVGPDDSVARDASSGSRRSSRSSCARWPSRCQSSIRCRFAAGGAPRLPAVSAADAPAARVGRRAPMSGSVRSMSSMAESPSEERLFVHRDYHPGNVLWEAGRVSGIVDWVNASVGSPWADVGHCRVNIASELGQQAADRFLDALPRGVRLHGRLPPLLGHLGRDRRARRGRR